jgi:hypothetical protein
MLRTELSVETQGLFVDSKISSHTLNEVPHHTTFKWQQKSGDCHSNERVWLLAPCEWEKGNMASVSPHPHAPCSCCIDHTCCPPSPHFQTLIVNQLSSFKCRSVSWQAWYFNTQCAWSHRSRHSSNRTPALSLSMEFKREICCLSTNPIGETYWLT